MKGKKIRAALLERVEESIHLDLETRKSSDDSFDDDTFGG